jgi:GntR family transcriptional regulator/MocR family aminotransferase
LRPPDAGATAWRWLYAEVRREILDGRLQPGTRLPSTRAFGTQYGLSRGTIVAAFAQLHAEGYVEGRLGSGTYVSTVLPDNLLDVRPSRTTRSMRSKLRAPDARPAGSSRAWSDYAALVRPFPRNPPETIRAFRTHLPAVDLFPVTLWASIAARHMRRAPLRRFLRGEALGYGPLREAIADLLWARRGVSCRASQIAIVSSVQQALDVMARLFVNPGDAVCMENPGYQGAVHVFEAAGAAIVPVGVDREGMVRPPPRAARARLAYVTPAHQYPLGVSMTLARRLQLLEWAHANGVIIVEDDYDSEFRYEGPPLPALRGLDRHDDVVLTGSFSKLLFPGIGLGYLVVPEDIIERVEAMLTVTYQHASLVNQQVLCDFITEGHLGRHLRRMRQVYAERRGVLLESAAAKLGGALEIIGIEAGLQTAAILGRGLNEDSVADAAGRRGVDVVPLGRCALEPLDVAGLVLGFAAVEPRAIRRGIDVLAGVIERV